MRQSIRIRPCPNITLPQPRPRDHEAAVAGCPHRCQTRPEHGQGGIEVLRQGGERKLATEIAIAERVHRKSTPHHLEPLRTKQLQVPGEGSSPRSTCITSCTLSCPYLWQDQLNSNAKSAYTSVLVIATSASRGLMVARAKPTCTVN